MEVELAFLSGGCNKISQCLSQASLSRPNIVAYGCHNGVAIYDTLKSELIQFLPGDNLIKKVIWIGSAPEWVLAGDDHGTIYAWNANTLSQEIVFTGRQSSLSGISAFQQNSVTFVCGCWSNGSIAIFKYDQESTCWKTIATRELGLHQIMEASAIVSLSADMLLLALGGVDNHVHFYRVGLTSKEISLLAKLKGHKAWIKAMDFCEDESGWLLATASQDKKIRLWKIHSVASSFDENSIDYLSVECQFQEETTAYHISKEAVLSGHDDWVTALHWFQGKLLSCSMDNTMICWEWMEDNWYPKTRVGEVGGNGIGLIDCQIIGNGHGLLAHNYHGQFYRWELQHDQWIAQRTVSGHCNAVMDIAWDPTNNYFISVSSDQTARMWCQENNSWYELSRPQIHGYDLTCVCFVRNQEHIYISGADEKVLRVFDAPEAVVDKFEKLTGIKRQDPRDRPSVAIVPELSLTNKTEEHDSCSQLNSEVARCLIWPEIQKLYGHGNELLCVAGTNSGRWIASACKSREKQFASIWLWDTCTWTALAEPLQGHSSSVVQLSFSPDDKYLASVSKDRHVTVYQENPNGYHVFATTKAHKRIIWSCSWSPDSSILATGSRDQTVKLWAVNKELESIELQHELPAFDSAVTAVAFAPSKQLTLAIGFENGRIEIWSKSSRWEQSFVFEPSICHLGSVKRICWRKVGDQLQLLTCSMDHCIRLFQINNRY